MVVNLRKSEWGTNKDILKQQDPVTVNFKRSKYGRTQKKKQNTLTFPSSIFSQLFLYLFVYDFNFQEHISTFLYFFNKL